MSGGDAQKNTLGTAKVTSIEDVERRWRSEGPQLIREMKDTDDSVILMAIVTKGTTDADAWPSYRDGGVVDLLINLVCERPDHGPDVVSFT